MTFCSQTRFLKSDCSVKQILTGILFAIFCIILFVIASIQDLAASSAYEQIYLSNYAALNFFSQSLDQSVSRLDDAFYDLRYEVTFVKRQIKKYQTFSLTKLTFVL